MCIYMYSMYVYTYIYIYIYIYVYRISYIDMYVDMHLGGALNALKFQSAQRDFLSELFL